MKFTLSWLRTHLDTPAGLDEIVRRLTMLGLEVDAVSDRAKDLAPFTVAEIVTAEQHPNADKLRVCMVATAPGAELLQVVCGAPNARAGLKTVFAPGGATIPRTGMVLKASTIRGVASNGMLCSGYELGITEDREGIVELAADAPVGASYAAYAGLDDPLLDVKITANRADCLGVRGIARDLAAAGLGKLKPLHLGAPNDDHYSSAEELPLEELRQNAKQMTERIVGSLSEREERVLRLRFGIGTNTEATLDEVQQGFAKTRARIRELEAKALRRRHPAPPTRSIWPVEGTFQSPISVHIEDTKACPLFIGRWIRGVKNGPSPQWLVDRLTSIGLRPISALVDITNLTTFDLDRPLHVFDAGKLKGDLTIRPAGEGESLAALNGKEYALQPGMTVIADASGTISLGGVIGGESTGCSEETNDVFIEAALFDPVRTAATGRTLNLQSDARYRFERGLDPAFVFDAVEIATRLVLDLCGGEPGEITVAGAEPEWRRRLTLRPSRVATLGGLAVEEAEISRILETLGCVVETDGDVLAVVPPSWRADIEGEADLVEEVLRIHGYDDIPVSTLPRETALPVPALDPAQRRAALVRRVLASRGIDEAVTYSFMPSAVLGAGNGAIFGPVPDSLVVGNPISADLDVMRPSILPNLLQAVQRNADRGFGDVGLFEIGPQYRSDTAEGQTLVAAGIRAGRVRLKGWDGAAEPVDAFDAKEDALAALAAAGVPVENLQVTADPPGWYHPGRAGTIRLGPKTVLAHFGEIHPRLLRALGLTGPAVGFEVHLDAVPPARAKQRAALKLSPFQPVSRDFAFIVDEAVTAEQILRAARSVDRKLVSDVRLFDLYTGTGVPEGKKSLAIAVTLQPVEATLTDEQIEAFSKALVAQVTKATGGTLRG